VVGAGSDTTAYTLTVLHFHLLDNPQILRTLRKELEGALPDKMRPAELNVVERLPYLVCFVPACNNFWPMSTFL
jgi:cytochrome P450